MKHCIVLIFIYLVSVAGAKSDVYAETAPAATVKTVAATKEAATSGETTEKHLPKDQAFTPWLLDPSVFAEDQGDRTEKRMVAEKDVKTIKLTNLVQPIRFPSGKADIPEEYVEILRGVLEKMRDRVNVRLHFVGHADPQALSDPLIEKYGDNTGLSRERAGTVAEYFQRALALPPEGISYEGLGENRPVASNATEAGRALNRRVEVEVWYDEIGEKMVEKEVVVPAQVNRVKVCRTETVCKMRYKEGHLHRARIKNLVAPLHYDAAMVTVPEEFTQQIRQALTNLHGKENIAVKFLAYGDTTPLQERDERIYGDQTGLSKAVARRVALATQDGLKLSGVAFESDGRGASNPVASNETPQGMAMNRRIEVEFWHDDPLQVLPDEPQLCPEDAGAETVTKVYDPPSGPIAPILFENGNPVLPEGYTERLRQLMDEIKDKTNVRLRFVGYISNERLDRRTAVIYGDDIGWSTARARRCMTAVSEKMGPGAKQAECEGRGYVQSADVVNAGFTESSISRVEVQIVYDELVPLDDYEGVDIVRMTREVKTADPFALNYLRISVDGKPVDDPNKSIPDVQRCTDVALDKAQIEFKFDNLRAEPRLNVTAWPRSIRYQDLPETEFAEDLVRFRLYTNYHGFIKRTEVRVFNEEQSVNDTPLAVIPMDGEGMAEWRPAFESFSAPVRKLTYLVRVYDADGNFDETTPQPLWVVDRVDPSRRRGGSGQGTAGRVWRKPHRAEEHSAQRRDRAGLRQRDSGRAPRLAGRIPGAGGRHGPVYRRGNPAEGDAYRRGCRARPVRQRRTLPARPGPEEERLVHGGDCRPDPVGQPYQRPRPAAATGQPAVQQGLRRRGAACLLHERPVRQRLGVDRQRGYARRAAGRDIQQLPGQDARGAVPAHRPGLPFPDLRR